MGMLYKGADLETVMTYNARRQALRLTSRALGEVRSNLTTAASGMLLGYRKYCAQQTNPGGWGELQARDTGLGASNEGQAYTAYQIHCVIIISKKYVMYVLAGMPQNGTRAHVQMTVAELGLSLRHSCSFNSSHQHRFFGPWLFSVPGYTRTTLGM